MPAHNLAAQSLTHGPVVGGVTASHANVFVRADQEAQVSIRYGTDPNLDTFLTTAPITTSSNNDFSSIIKLDGLPPQTTIYLNVEVNGTPQLSAPFPSFATFPATSDPQPFKFVVLSDFTSVRLLTNTVPTYGNALLENPAFAFIGGDFDHREPHTIPERRTMFKDLYDASSPVMGDFVHSILWKMPIAHQWDDHDAGSNNVDKTFLEWDLAQQVFEEFVPSYPLPLVTPGIWQSFSYAQVDFFVLDCRSQRDPDPDVDGPDKSMLDGNALGAAGQLVWLENGLLASRAKWKVIFTSVITNPTTKLTDGWAAFQTEWNSLRNFIEANAINGVVFISGDLHLGAIDNGVASGFPEMCIQQPNGFVGSCPTSVQGTWSEGTFKDECRGYSVVTLMTHPDRMLLEVKDENGNQQLAYTVTLADSVPPTAPSNLTATALDSSQVMLAWTASSDDFGVTGYDIYRDNVLLASVGEVTNQPDDTVSPLTTYQYQVRARDGAGNISDPSNVAQVTVPALTKWEINVKGSDQGLVVVNFRTDQTLDGYGISQDAFGLLTVSGSWSTNNGALTGHYLAQAGSQTITDGALSGDIRPGKKLKAKISASVQTLKLKGTPFRAGPDLSGHWIGQVKSKAGKSTETYDFMPDSNLPGVFHLTGQGVGNLTGEAIVSSENAVSVHLHSDTGEDRALEGKVSTKKQTLSLKGKDQSGLKFTIKAAKGG